MATKSLPDGTGVWAAAEAAVATVRAPTANAARAVLMAAVSMESNLLGVAFHRAAGAPGWGVGSQAVGVPNVRRGGRVSGADPDIHAHGTHGGRAT
jgi:hypothetical protein